MANEKKMDYMILGLLRHESMTGYEIKKRIDTTLRFFWGASYGSIYPTLARLVKEENVTKVETKEKGREKIIYTITELGHKDIKEWLLLPVEKDELRFETLLKLFFGAEIGAAEMIHHITRFEDKAKQDFPFLERSVKQLEKLKDDSEDHMYYMLTAMFGEKIYKAYLEWCEEVKIELEKHR